MLIIDALGCGLCGFSEASEEADWIIDLVKEQGGNDEATVFCNGFKISAANAALANATIAHTIDSDDSHMESLTYLGASLIPTIFAIGERVHAGGSDIITAFVLGFKAAARIERSVIPTAINLKRDNV